jgi:hypothetical protein
MDAQPTRARNTDPRQQPRSPAPSRSSPHYARAAWSEMYVAWYVSQVSQEGPLPPDVLATHLYEVEYAYCMQDPQRYERETQQELRAPVLH